MSITVSAFDLQNKYSEISKLAKESKQPIYIKVNGSDDGVFLTNDLYEQLVFELEFFKGLLEAEVNIAQGKTRTHEEIFSELKKKFKLTDIVYKKSEYDMILYRWSLSSFRDLGTTKGMRPFFL